MSADTKPTVVELLAKVMEDVQAVSKDSRNESQGFSFRGIDAVMNAVGPALRKHGVVAMPVKSAAEYREVEVGKNRTKQRECTVMVTYRFHGPAGDYVDAEVPAEALDSGDKATSKAMSVAYRTALLQALTIPTDEPDPDSTSVERSGVRQALNKGQAKYQLVEAAKELTDGQAGAANQLAARVWQLSGAAAREEFDEGSMATLTDLLHGLHQPHVAEALEQAEARQASRDTARRNRPAAGSPAPAAADPHGERDGVGDTGEQQSLVEAGS